MTAGQLIAAIAGAGLVGVIAGVVFACLILASEADDLMEDLEAEDQRILAEMHGGRP